MSRLRKLGGSAYDALIDGLIWTLGLAVLLLALGVGVGIVRKLLLWGWS